MKESLVLHLIAIITISHVIAVQKIPGPKSFDDKIAIVGAGPSGVHMAYLLKKKGFKNLHILEKSSRIGGKSETVYHRNIPIDLGTETLLGENIYQLAKEFIPSKDIVKPAATTVWTDASVYPAIGHLNLSEAVDKYAKISEEILGVYDKVPAKPSKEKLWLARGSTKEFLIRNNLTLLTSVFASELCGTGLGRLDEVPALYALLHMRKERPLTGWMFKSGFQPLWERIVTREKIPVTFNVDILSVDRKLESEKKVVWLHKKVGSEKPIWERYDFLIWSPEMKTSMGRWEKYVDIERELFSGTVARYFTASIVDSENERRSTSTNNFWIDNALHDRQNSVTQIIDFYGAINQYHGKQYADRKLRNAPDNKPITTFIVYQPSLYLPTESELKKHLVNHFRHFDATSIKIIKMKTWRFFAHYSSSQMIDGCLWKILDIQGKYGMWYIGGSAWLEGIPWIINYNTHLVDHMEMPVNNA